MKNSKKIVNIIDADFLLYVATSGNKIFDNEGNAIRENNKFVYTEKTFEEVTKCADDIIRQLINLADADYYIGYIGNSKCFRYSIDENYKANRKDSVKPSHFKQLKNYLVKKWSFELLENGLEADDAVNIARNLLKNEYNVFISTTDKDLIKCIPGKYINARDFTIIRTSKEKANEAFWTSMIVGDSVDNIPGLKGRGKKYAEYLFKDPIIPYKELVINAYKIDLLEDWENEFNKMYKLLYILDDFEGFQIKLINKEEGGFGERDITSREVSAEKHTNLW